jgi:hypothetical protein
MAEEVKVMQSAYSGGFSITWNLTHQDRANSKNDDNKSQNGELHQIQAAIQVKKVIVEERIDGEMLIRQNNDSLNVSGRLKTSHLGSNQTQPFLRTASWQLVIYI